MQPGKTWVTAAETSELAISFAVHGDYKQSAIVYNWLHHMRDDDGAYWYGVAYPENEIWPLEKPTWTSAAVVLAADMLRPISPTSLLLDHQGAAFFNIPNEPIIGSSLNSLLSSAFL